MSSLYAAFHFANAERRDHRLDMTWQGSSECGVQMMVWHSPGHDNELDSLVLQSVLKHGFHLQLPLLFWHVWLSDAHKIDSKLLGYVAQVWVVGHNDTNVALELTCTRLNVELTLEDTRISTVMQTLLAGVMQSCTCIQGEGTSQRSGGTIVSQPESRYPLVEIFAFITATQS